MAISDRTCRREWFQRFKSGDFAVEDWHSGGGEKVVEDAELKVSEDLCHTQEELSESLGISEQAISKCLKQLGMIEKEGCWDIGYPTSWNQEEMCKDACLFVNNCWKGKGERQTRKRFLHRIVTGDDSCQKWAHYNNSNPNPRIARWSYCNFIQHLGRISMTQKSCFAFGGDQLLKPSESVGNHHKPYEMGQSGGETISRNVEMANFTSPTVLSRCCFVSFSHHSHRSMARPGRPALEVL
nr:Mariner Mos1 transposase [Hymenolepis microstoma]